MNKPRDDGEEMPNPAGGFEGLLFPYRRWVLLAALIAIPVLIVISILT